MATPGMVASVEWTDGKCYLWMLGALPIIAAVSALATGGIRCGGRGRSSCLRSSRCSIS